MTSSLLESVFIPGPKSDAKQLYNITLVEKLLRILYASCQYGEGTCYYSGDVRFSHRLLPSTTVVDMYVSVTI